MSFEMNKTMVDSQRNVRVGSTYLLQRAKSAAAAVPSFQYKRKNQTQLKRQPTVVLYVDEHCPIHGTQGGSHHGSNNNIVLTDIKPFNNNPPLPNTQRDIVGNNLHFNSLSPTNGWNDLPNEQLGSLLLYRDALKQNLTTPAQAGGGYPKVRLGRGGGYWRHIQQTNSHSGSNLVYINGTVRVDDSFKYPRYRFGYPSVNRIAQPVLAPPPPPSPTSTQNLSNGAAQSLDASTWSLKYELNHRPSLAQYSNQYEQHAKDGFAYWPPDPYYKKPRSKTGTTGTYKSWLGLSDAILKL